MNNILITRNIRADIDRLEQVEGELLRRGARSARVDTEGRITVGVIARSHQDALQLVERLLAKVEEVTQTPIAEG